MAVSRWGCVFFLTYAGFHGASSSRSWSLKKSRSDLSAAALDESLQADMRALKLSADELSSYLWTEVACFGTDSREK